MYLTVGRRGRRDPRCRDLDGLKRAEPDPRSLERDHGARVESERPVRELSLSLGVVALSRDLERLDVDPEVALDVPDRCLYRLGVDEVRIVRTVVEREVDPEERRTLQKLGCDL